MKDKKRILLIGAGVSNASLARIFLNDGHYVEIHEKTSELGGMLHDEYDKESKCWVSNPHIIHAKKGNEKAIDWLKKQTKLVPFKHKVMCIGDSSFTFFPINESYSELYEFMYPEREMKKEFIDSYSKKMWEDSYEEVMLNIEKRWIPKKSRIPDFFEGQLQFQPKNGYSNMIKDLIKGAKLIVEREENFETIEWDKWDLVILSSNIDEFFKFRLGTLEFKGLDFVYKKIETDGSNLLPSPVVNLPLHKRIVRITESNQMQSYKNNSKVRVLCFDVTGSDKNRFYPVLTERNKNLLEKYFEKVKQYPKLVLHGRTSEYCYKDIDDCVNDSIKLYNKLKNERNL